MNRVHQKRDQQVNIYLSEKEKILVETYINSLEEYQPISAAFRKALLEKIKNDNKNKD